MSTDNSRKRRAHFIGCLLTKGRHGRVGERESWPGKLPLRISCLLVMSDDDVYEYQSEDDGGGDGGDDCEGALWFSV